jgi:hypothetical protein
MLGLVVCGSLVVLAFIVMRADDSEHPRLVAHLTLAVPNGPNLRAVPPSGAGSASRTDLLLPLVERPSFVCTPQQVKAQAEDWAARDIHKRWPTMCTCRVCEFVIPTVRRLMQLERV